MIGQSSLISKIRQQVENEVYPRFSILVGQKGSGKKTLAKNIIPSMFDSSILYVLEDVKVDTIRDMINQSYKTVGRTIYIIPDADNMSAAAKNALLKVTEEPPYNAYFIMTMEDINNTLSTIRSRGTVFLMDNYSPEEIYKYAMEKYSKQAEPMEVKEIIIDLCETPGEVDTLFSNNVSEFYDYVLNVVDNISTCSGANSFKIADKIALKDSDESKYDLRLFWKAFMKECSNRLNSDPIRFATGIKITSKYLQELKITGINRISTFDMWILDLRQEWME